MVGKTKDIGSHLKAVISHVNGPIVAGGAGDGVEVNGATIDRKGFDSALLLVPHEANLSGSDTLTVAVQLQHGDESDASDMADLGTTYNITSATLSADGEGLLAVDIDLSGVKRYVRAQVTPTLSAGATDTAEVSSVFVLGGADELPASESTRQSVSAL